MKSCSERFQRKAGSVFFAFALSTSFQPSLNSVRAEIEKVETLILVTRERMPKANSIEEVEGLASKLEDLRLVLQQNEDRELELIKQAVAQKGKAQEGLEDALSDAASRAVLRFRRHPDVANAKRALSFLDLIERGTSQSSQNVDYRAMREVLHRSLSGR